QADLLQLARDKTLQVILKSAQLVRPGMTEKEAKLIVQEIQADLGAPKCWHPPQIRFGENTLLSFGKPGKEGVVLGENDIFFFDIGPIFDGHEGDVGRPFTIGADPEMRRCCNDAEVIWNEVRDHWSTTKVSGRELYNFAKSCASDRGWTLTLEKANGHRIA